MTTIQYCSDLHLEQPENARWLRANPLTPKGEVLVLAGDIIPFAERDQANEFFSYVADHFKTTYWLPGNHEYFGSDITERSGSFREAVRSNVILLNNQVEQLHGIRLIFSTLWSHVSPLAEGEVVRAVTDYRSILYEGGRFRPMHSNRLHQECRSFIASAVGEVATGRLGAADPAEVAPSGLSAAGEASGAVSGAAADVAPSDLSSATQASDGASGASASRLAVVTHHVPTFMHYPKQFRGSLVNEAFATELSDYIARSPIDAWIYGHHHQNTPEFRIGRTRMLTNQLGYVRKREYYGFRREGVANF